MQAVAVQQDGVLFCWILGIRKQPAEPCYILEPSIAVNHYTTRRKKKKSRYLTDAVFLLKAMRLGIPVPYGFRIVVSPVHLYADCNESFGRLAGKGAVDESLRVHLFTGHAPGRKAI